MKITRPKQSFVWLVLSLWIALSLSWFVISRAYSVHLRLFPLPDANSWSMNLIAFLLYVPPVFLLIFALNITRRTAASRRIMNGIGWILAALLIVPTGLAIFTAYEIVTFTPFE